MNYRLDRYGNKISLLGFGCMRLPQTAGIINKAEAEKQIMAAKCSPQPRQSAAAGLHRSDRASGKLHGAELCPRSG